MAVTRIINVQRSDSFEDVFGVFKNIEAQEVIFIFPKGSKLSKKQDYFNKIKGEADERNIKVSVMTSDPIITLLASAQGLEILETPLFRKAQGEATLASAAVTDDVAIDNEKEEDAEGETIKKDETEENIDDDKTADKSIEENIGNDEEEKEIKDDEQAIGKETDTDDNPLGEATDYEENELVPEAVLAAQGKGKPGHEPKFADVITSGIKKRISATEKTKANIMRMWAANDNNRHHAVSHLKNRSGSGHSWKKIFGYSFGGVIVIMAILFFVVKGNAEVTIKPQKHDVNFNLRVAASTNVTAVDAESGKIPGQLFDAKVQESGKYKASGSKDVAQKAYGKIVIYNELTEPQRLVATTRFESDKGLIFRIPQSINVPAATRVSSGVVPGKIESIVYADRAGADYNIAAGRFTVPGFKGTPKYDKFYGISDKPMSGGIIGPSSIVLEMDYINAQNELTKKVRDSSLAALKDQTGDLKVLDSFKIALGEPNANAKAGEAASELQMTISANAKTIAFRETDINALINHYMDNNSDYELLQKGLDIQYSSASFSSDDKELSFIVYVKGQAVSKIDKDKIAKDIAGLNESDLKVYIKKVEEIESAKIVLSPFWIRKLPKDISRIKVIIDTE
ncbi:MAG: Uncharacterized protein CEN90_104 [Parcubacteria group bacterium Licking1014_17]|nr:MAG: Uncharacterized protein CEN90_104 [Parcubacteria group bacterium Licking1014_17]